MNQITQSHGSGIPVILPKQFNDKPLTIIIFRPGFIEGAVFILSQATNWQTVSANKATAEVLWQKNFKLLKYWLLSSI